VFPAALSNIAKEALGLRLLLLHGSRARGDAHAESDWDFAYLADPAFEPSALHAALSSHLKTDAVDLADLQRAGGLLRYRAASEGELVFEREPGERERFVLEAVRFWLEAGPVITRSQRAVLERLG
jgi:predicted nucleotidyltransferase